MNYFRCLKNEAALWRHLGDGSADTVFLGGGTPSSVKPEYIADILGQLDIAEGAEVSIETNPGTLSEEKLRVYRECGINRLSMGVQSFDDDELDFLGRIHSAQEARQSFEMARRAGFGNINIDLIFGFPGHTLDSWKRTLSTAMELGPEHISFYSLQIEEGTKLYDMFRDDEVDQVSDEINREMYSIAMETLKENGYVHYEISNAAKPGFECRHNLGYWKMKPYVGLGAGAHSYIGNTRFFNPDGLAEYENQVRAAAKQQDFFYGRELAENSWEDTVTDYIFTGLRLAEGISLADFSARFGVDFFEKYPEAAQQFLEGGYLKNEKNRIFFTKKGIDISNFILENFM